MTFIDKILTLLLLDLGQTNPQIFIMLWSRFIQLESVRFLQVGVCLSLLAKGNAGCDL